MTGKEMLEFLSSQPKEVLEQDVMFEVLVGVAPAQVVSGHVPVVEAHVVDNDQLLTPDGFMDPETAMNTYKEQQAAAAACEITEKEASEYMPSNCPKILSKNQVLMKLQGIKAYTEVYDPDLPDPVLQQALEKYNSTPEPVKKDPVMIISKWENKGED